MAELLELAARVAGWAGPGEEVEAYVGRGSDTSVRVYDGDVEAFSAADSEGVGVRVVAGGRQGFAYLDLDKAAADAIERSTRMLGAVKPPSTRLPVVLEDTVAAAFLSIVGGTLSGEAVLKGRSLFANRQGEDVAAAMVALVDD